MKQNNENTTDELIFNILSDMVLSNKEIQQKIIEAEKTLDEAIVILKELAANLQPTPKGEDE